MRKIRINRWPFTKKQGNTSSAMPSSPTSKDIPSCRWSQGIATLYLDKFIDVAVDGNYSALIIAGYPAQLELELAWANIQQEYAHAIGDHEHKLYVSLYNDITLIQIKLHEVRELVKVLAKFYYKPLADKLNNLLLTAFKFDPDKPEEYLKLLQGCLNRAKGWQIDLELKQIHFDAIQEKNKQSGTKSTREYFQSVLITISDHAKYPVIAASITVYEFCERVKRFNKYCEQVEKQARKYGR